MAQLHFQFYLQDFILHKVRFRKIDIQDNAKSGDDYAFLSND